MIVMLYEQGGDKMKLESTSEMHKKLQITHLSNCIVAVIKCQCRITCSDSVID